MVLEVRRTEAALRAARTSAQAHAETEFGRGEKLAAQNCDQQTTTETIFAWRSTGREMNSSLARVARDTAKRNLADTKYQGAFFRHASIRLMSVWATT